MRQFLEDHAAFASQCIKRLFGKKSEGPWEILDRRGALLVRGARVRDARIIERIGTGANGVVFRVSNESLQREEALKIWITLRSGDDRDKAVQAIQEARKQAAAVGHQVVSVYGVERVRGLVLARMQYVPGKNLKEHLKAHPESRAEMLIHYMHLMQQTTKPGIYHGDPHPGNVLVFLNESDKYDKHWQLVLCDFGTSCFSEDATAGKKRHWKKIRETTEALLRHLPDYKFCWAAFERNEEMIVAQISSLASVESPHLSDREREELEISLQFAPYRDLENDLTELWRERFRKQRPAELL